MDQNRRASRSPTGVLPAVAPPTTVARAGSASSPGPTATRAARSSISRSPASPGCATARRSRPTGAPATAPGSSSRSRARSSPASRATSSGATVDPDAARRRVPVPRSRRRRRRAAGRSRGRRRARGARGSRSSGWRDVPVRDDQLGDQARATAPAFRQAIIAAPDAARRGEPRSARRTAPAASPSSGAATLGVRVHGRELGLRDGHVQGARDQRPAAVLLPGSRGHGLRRAARGVPQPLLDQHHAGLGAGAAVPDAVPQR